MKKYGLILIGIFILAGCTGVTLVKPGEKPVGCENSLIYKYDSNPNFTNSVIKLAIYESLKEKPKQAREVQKVLKSLRLILNKPNITYRDFGEEVLRQVKIIRTKFGVEVMIISDSYTSILDYTIAIDPCDKSIFSTNIERLIDILGLIK